jgi:tripartite-type tricarboxylate transporter receptor subunit TctC
MMFSKICSFICVFGLLMPLTSGAADFPEKTVKLVVPYAPAGPNDFMARLVGQKLTELWGQPVVVENRPGAGGNTGTAFVAKAKPDGYTVLVTTSTVAANMSLFSNPGYDLEKELIAVANIASTPNVILAGSGFKVKGLLEIKDDPKFAKLNYGSPGTGTTAHLSLDYFFKLIMKTDATHVPYKGAGPALNAAVGGEIDIVSMAMPPSVPLVKAGKIQALAVTGKTRVNAMPDVPTLNELGIKGMDLYTWVGVFLPSGTPADIVKKINADIGKVLGMKDIQDKLAVAGFSIENQSPENFAKTVKSEIGYWKQVLTATGTKPQ